MHGLNIAASTMVYDDLQRGDLLRVEWSGGSRFCEVVNVQGESVQFESPQGVRFWRTLLELKAHHIETMPRAVPPMSFN